MKYLIIILILLQYLFANDSYYYQYHNKKSLTKLTTLSRDNSRLDYYQTERGIIVGVSDKLILKLKKSDNIKKYLSDFNLTMVKILNKNMYLVKVKNKTLTIDISNRLSEKESVEYAHPDFVQKRVKR